MSKLDSKQTSDDIHPETRAHWVAVPREYNATVHFVDRHLAEGRSHKTAYIDDLGTYTYAELSKRVNRAGNVLLELGVQRGQRVMMCLLDGIDFAALFWGAMKIGAIPVPVNTFLGAQDYDHLLRDSGAKVLALSASLLPLLESAIRDKPDLENVVLCGPASQLDHSSFSALCEKADDHLKPAATKADDTGFWLYSSGSTGRPKAVLHRHGDLVQCAELYGRRVLGITENDVVFSASKMFFAYGLGNSCAFPLHTGATVLLTAERTTPDAVMRLLRRHRPTIFCGVPTLFASILAIEPAPVPSLRICTSAGEALPPAVAQSWTDKFGVEILDGLGSTEALHIFISNLAGQTRAGSSGKPVPGYEVTIRKDDGQEAGPGEIADLWCRGPSIASGYWNNDDVWQRTYVNGWLKTGDKYSRDADGYHYYAGRSDDMLKVGGLWVSPVEVEAVLIEHPEVAEAAVIGAPDADSLVKPKGFVVLRNPASASSQLVEELKQFARHRLASHKCPRWIEFRTELPRTATGKLRRHELRDPKLR